MKRTLVAATLLLSSLFVDSALAQVHSELALPPDGKNQRAEVAQWIGLVKVTVDYHSPNVHGRGADRAGHIWGELVQYGLFDEGFGPSRATPWRAGANETTTVSFSHDVKIGGRDVRAGTYGLFLEVQPSGRPWTWILSTQAGWGAYQYDPKYDVVRVSAAPEAAPYTEFLTYGFDDRRLESATAFLQWEKQRVALKIDVPNSLQVYVDQMRKDLLGWPGFNYQNWQNAAQFCADNKINLGEALVWADKAISEPFRNAAQGKKDFSTLRTKASVLRAMERGADADGVMDEAVAMPDAPV